MSQSLFTRLKRSFAFVACIALFQLMANNVQAQTNPVPQALPYTQTFSTFTGTTTTYPAGWQGWVIGTNESSSINTSSPSANQAMQVGGATNASPSAFVADMNQKIGLFSTGSNERSICLALNTSGATNVVVNFQAGTQEQVGPPTGRVDQISLLYRIGTSGAFTPVSGSSYQNNGLTLINTGSAATNTMTIGALLPVACNNQPTVEIEWVETDISGSGTRPSFSITNINCAQGVVTTYYSKSTGNLDNVATWGTNTDGTGTAPTNFTGNLHEFHLVNGNTGNITTNWVISGTASKLVVDLTDFTVPSTHTVTATIDVNAGRTLTLANATLPTLGTLNPTSTEIFSGLTSVVIPSAIYGNIVFNNSSVAIPVSNISLTFAGNFTLQGTGTFTGANLISGYSLVTTGTGNQLINGNGTTISTWNFDVGSSNTKGAGIVTLAANTNVNVNNSMDMVLSGAVNQFNDGGNTISVVNNIDLGGNTSSYNFTGTLNANAAGSGSANFRGGGSSSNPCVATFNNVNFNNTIPIQIRPTSGAVTLTIRGNLTIANTATALIDFDGNTLSIGGNLTYNAPANNFNMSTAGSTLEFNGTGAQTYTSTTRGGDTLVNLTMDNTSTGLTLNNSLNVTGMLTLTAGNITTGADTLYIDSTGSVSGANAASYVKGYLSKKMPLAGTTSINYEVGDVTFSPIQLAFGSSVTAGRIVVKSNSGAHPQVLSSYVNTGNMVNRYWTISNAGVSTLAINPTLSYNSADITGGGASNIGYIMRQYNGTAWSTAPSVTNSTSTSLPLLAYSTASTGISGTSFSGDYIAGAPQCTIPVGGTAIASPSSLCSSGTSSLSLTGASSGNYITYQWSSSPDGLSWTPISGATTTAYSTPTITTTTYYENTVTCLLTTSITASSTATVTVNPTSPISGIAIMCVGDSVRLTDIIPGGTWSSTNTAIAVIDAAGYISGISAGTSGVTYTFPSGCLAFTAATIHALPVIDTVTGGGSYCTFDTGVHIGLTGSTAGISYQLYNGGTPQGAPVTGTGSALDLGLQTAAGFYTVIATNTTTHCTSSMYGSDTITVIPIPIADTVIGGGGYCSGDSGVHVGLDSSMAGVIYQLYLGSTPVGTPDTGTGAALDFGLQTGAGIYTVIAGNPLTACSTVMTGSVTVTINPLPVAYNVTGGGSYCAGGAGEHIGLSNSDLGIRYQLYNGSVASGTPENGLSGVLDFGLNTAAGTYSVMATDTTTGCTSAMNDSAVIIINPSAVPQVRIATGVGFGDTVCLGSLITFIAHTRNGGATPSYQWTVNNLNVGTPDSTYPYIPANGDVVAVEVTSSATCVLPDTATDTIRIRTLTPAAPSVFILVSPATSISIGQPDTLIAVPTNCGSSPRYQWFKNGVLIPGATNDVYTSSSFANRDSVTCRVITSGACGGEATFNSVVVTVFPAGIAAVSAGNSMIQLIPNPNKGIFTVKGSLGTTQDEEVALTITDMLGQVVYTVHTMSHGGNINEQVTLGNSLANGIYLLSVHSGSENKVFHFVLAQ